MPSCFLCPQTISRLGLPSISQASVSRIRKRVFSNVDVKKFGCMFFKCTECELLKDFIQKAVKGRDDWFSLRATLNNHLRHQESYRRLYHSWRHESIMSSSEFMCIIHDRMDMSKTALLRLRVQSKMIYSLSQLPVSLTGMVTHGHRDGVYAHYSNELWPNESNFTVSSLARLLRTLKRPPSRDSKVLFEHPPHNDLLRKLLHGKSRCLEALSLATGPPTAPLKSLPKNLYLQLDNCACTNKNRFVMTYCPS